MQYYSRTEMKPASRIRTRKSNLLDRVRLTESERLAAQQYMEQGELIADFVLAVIAAVRSVMHGIERGLRGQSKYTT